MENTPFMSQDISQLALALSKMQGMVGTIPKTKEAKIQMKSGGNYTYHYADLADIQNATATPLATNELACSQIFREGEKGTVLITLLVHSSGQWIRSEKNLDDHEKVQELGSEITYLRRYTLSSILGIVTDDDDDGHIANEAKNKKASHEESSKNTIPPIHALEIKSRLSGKKEIAKEFFNEFHIEKITDLRKEDYQGALSWIIARTEVEDEVAQAQ